MMQQFRWRNFRCFTDTGWVDIKPLTIVIGANNSGKSSLIAPLLMMKQTVESADNKIPLMTKGPLINAGAYRDFIRNHDTTLPLSLDVRVHYHSESEMGDETELGQIPPGEFEAGFSYTDDLIPDDLELTRYIVKDIQGRLLLSRIKQPNGNFSLNFKPNGSFSKLVRREILADKPSHFMFKDAPLHKIFRDSARKESSNPRQLNFSGGEMLYFATASTMAGEIESFLEKVTYLGPLREQFKRLYEFSGETPQDIGVRGENTPELIARGLNNIQKAWINKWTEKFDFGGKLKAHVVNDQNMFYLELFKGKKSTNENLFDTGSGLSQVLPLIVEGIRSPKDKLIICEQPEIHLNPKLQVLLADLLVSIAQKGKSCIVETHSEHLILRLRRLIAEGKLDSDLVAVLFVEKKRNGSSVREIPITKNGHIDESDWPIGFFGESLEEAMGLALSQSNGERLSGG